MVYESLTTQDTFELGRQLGVTAKKGQVFCLNGDLGVGKTVFSKGFAVGLGISEPISSPTYTIVLEYSQGKMPLYHFDVYRIEYVEEMEEIGYEDYFFGEGVCLVEWAERIEELLPKDCITILIEKDLSLGFEYRRITVDSERK